MTDKIERITKRLRRLYKDGEDFEYMLMSVSDVDNKLGVSIDVKISREFVMLVFARFCMLHPDVRQIFNKKFLAFVDDTEKGVFHE